MNLSRIACWLPVLQASLLVANAGSPTSRDLVPAPLVASAPDVMPPAITAIDPAPDQMLRELNFIEV